MKRYFQTLLCTTFVIFLASCSTTNKLTMSAIEPAPITLSKEVTRIGIINRSLPSEGNKTFDKLDQILTAEGKELDKDGSEAAIIALKEQLELLDYITEVVIIEDNENHKAGLGKFPMTLTWNEVEHLCNDNQVDAIFSLAFYDTDTKFDYRSTTINVPNDLGVTIKMPSHELRLNTLVQNGWRVYDPIKRRIADELVFSDHVINIGKGINPIKAYEAIKGRKGAILHRSKYMGIDYALRLLPNKKRVQRDYFVRGSENFKIAQRRAQAGDWEGAANLWNIETTHKDPKVAGRACYNMAISHEIKGNLDTALQWATKSFTVYDNSYALSYLNTLKYRAGQNELLNEQLSK